MLTIAQLRSQLLQAQKMAAMGRLAGGIAHDFNNLLTTILGNAELLLAVTPPHDSRYEALEEIWKAVNSGARLAAQLLAISRRSEGGRTVLNVNSVVVDFEGIVRRVLGEDVELTTRLDPDLWNVRIDRGQLEQILVNLAVNARDAMPGGGRLTFETTNVRLAAAPDDPPPPSGDHVLLRVADTGVGMSAEVRRRATEPFFTTKGTNGTGLGLSTVDSIARAHGGFLRIQSEVGRGTTIELYLPREWSVEEAADASPSGPPPRGSERILIVDDDRGVCAVSQMVLERHGYSTTVAVSPRQALEIAERATAPFDLLLTDMVMPEMGGRSLARAIQDRQPAIKTLFMSGYAQPVVGDDSEPPAPFLEKPYPPARLLRSVREALS